MNLKKLHPFVALLVLISATATTGCLTVPQNELDELASIGANFLKGYLAQLSIPRQKGSNYEAWNIKLESFNLGAISIKQPKRCQFRICIKGAYLRARADWKAWKKIWFFTLRKSGSLRASGSNIDLCLTIELGTRNGRPYFSYVPKSCYANIGKFDAKVYNTSLKWIVNLIINLFEKRIRDKIEDRICPAVESAMTKNVAKLNQQLLANLHLRG
ncbi:bactericidal permeability-increasing protein-like [Clavelina lepadiformis]|uniref:bactericidal permeability-increasing protein-like n=1 Tax=Clavelina lepadiformis TaxID=159417 RepID=UPI0040417CCB